MLKYFQFFLLCLIWGTTYAAIKIGSDSTPPMVGLAIRYGIALLVLFPIIRITGRKIPVDRASVKLYLVAGVFNMALSYLCTYWAMNFIPSSLSSILWATFPLFNGILAHMMIPSEHLNVRRLTSIIISMIGVILILSDQKLVFNTQVLIGCIVVLLGVLIGAYSNIYIKRFGDNYDPLILTAVSLLIGGLIHLFGAFLLSQFADMTWSLRNIGAAAYLGIFGSAMAFFMYYSLLRKIEVVKMSFVTFLSPIVASLVGLTLLHEIITFKEIGGIFLIFCGLFIYDFRKYYHHYKSYKSMK
ncbi:MAG: DMT family transporter [Candidatus Marinimicrobia bacterium]|nr:DMT family transporter [Candidatus Neomarinimicrobiota bacterium]